MPARYMLDTNICSYIKLRRRAPDLERYELIGADEAVMSVVTFGEMRVGAEKGQYRERDLSVLHELTKTIRIEPLDDAVAAAYGEIRSYLSARGDIIGPNDLWIAAHARSAGLTLVTGNEREFRRVPGLRVENWAA